MKNSLSNSIYSNISSKSIEHLNSSSHANQFYQPSVTILGNGKTKRKRSKDSYIEIALERENYKNLHSNSNSLNQSRTSKSISNQKNKTLNTESLDSEKRNLKNFNEMKFNDYLLNQNFRNENLNLKNLKNSLSQSTKCIKKNQLNKQKKNGIPIGNSYTLNNSNGNLNQFENLSYSHRRNPTNIKNYFLNYTMRESEIGLNKKKISISNSLNNSQNDSKNNSKRSNSNYEEKPKLYKGLNLNLISNRSKHSNNSIKSRSSINHDNDDFTFYKNEDNDFNYYTYNNNKIEVENYSNKEMYDTQIYSPSSNIYPSSQRYIYSSNDNKYDNEFNKCNLHNINNSLSIDDLSTNHNNDKNNNEKNIKNPITNFSNYYNNYNKENNPNFINKGNDYFYNDNNSNNYSNGERILYIYTNTVKNSSEKSENENNENSNFKENEKDILDKTKELLYESSSESQKIKKIKLEEEKRKKDE